MVNWLQVLRPMFRHRHPLVFYWLLVCQAIYQEKATGTELARLVPRHIAEWHLRRLLTAAYWNARTLLWWFADQAISALPPPEGGVRYLVVDSTLKGETGQKHPFLPNVTARQAVDVYRRRWSVELLMKELKGATGLGHIRSPKSDNASNARWPSP